MPKGDTHTFAQYIIFPSLQPSVLLCEADATAGIHKADSVLAGGTRYMEITDKHACSAHFSYKGQVHMRFWWDAAITKHFPIVYSALKLGFPIIQTNLLKDHLLKIATAIQLFLL